MDTNKELKELSKNNNIMLKQKAEAEERERKERTNNILLEVLDELKKINKKLKKEDDILPL
jgi:hypothetical protein